MATINKASFFHKQVVGFVMLDLMSGLKKARRSAFLNRSKGEKDMGNIKRRSVLGIAAACAVTLSVALWSVTSLMSAIAADASMDYTVDLSALTCTESGTAEAIKTYTEDDYETFLLDYESDSLPEIYITEFLYDGVGMVQKVSTDDDTGEVEIKDISTTVINVNTTGNIEFTGTAEDTMIAVDTNGVTGDINLYLNGVNLESNKKTPAIMVYNKSVAYDDCKVTIKTVSGTENYIEGGKLKKVSTMLLANVKSYTKISSNYSDTESSYYYYFENEKGVSDLSNLLYAVETADNEKVSEGDPYTYYKYSGAISSDIALYFEGEGYLEIASKGDEGIETKGDIVMQGGTGDYKVTAYDDGLNASTNGTDISIDVNSLYVDVLDEGEDDSEGDGIDSNGTLHILGGTITALAHPTSGDSGLDSDSGTYINGGTVFAIGNMADEISSESTQQFMILTFKEQQPAGSKITVTDTDGNTVAEFTSDRTFTTLVISSADLSAQTYYVYRDGVQQQYSGSSSMGMGGDPGQQGGDTPPDMNGEPTTNENGEPSTGDGQTPPEKLDGDGSEPATGDGSEPATGDGTTPPEMPDGSEPTTDENGEPSTGDGNMPGGNQGTDTNGEASVEFILTATAHTFANVTDYVEVQEETTELESASEEETTDSETTTDAETATEAETTTDAETATEAETTTTTDADSDTEASTTTTASTTAATTATASTSSTAGTTSSGTGTTAASDTTSSTVNTGAESTLGLSVFMAAGAAAAVTIKKRRK